MKAAPPIQEVLKQSHLQLAHVEKTTLMFTLFTLVHIPKGGHIGIDPSDPSL